MRVLEQLEPQGVFRFFEELCAIPHGSRNCQAVSDWCAAFARERGLECHQDQAGNVIIIQEATPGYEAAAPVILQGHLDMVCEKEPGCTKDMAGEGLDLLVEDGCVRAKGTTLGGDDGIAVAMALAILDDQAIPHPRLEWSSPRTRRLECWGRRSWTPRLSGGGSSSTWTPKRRESSPSAAQAEAWLVALCL